MILSAELETKRVKSKTRAHGSLEERFSRYVYLNDFSTNESNGNDSNNTNDYDYKGNKKNSIKNNCWYWIGARNDRGYGVIGRGSRKQGIIKAHRIAYELFYFTKLEKDKCVCHTCDNPACVNPQHLFIGTQADNVADMIAKGRNVLPPIRRGNKSNLARLNDKKISQIRKLANGGSSSRKIAKQFEVSNTTILQVVQRKSWRHV